DVARVSEAHPGSTDLWTGRDPPGAACGGFRIVAVAVDDDDGRSPGKRSAPGVYGSADRTRSPGCGLRSCPGYGSPTADVARVSEAHPGSTDPRTGRDPPGAACGLARATIHRTSSTR